MPFISLPCLALARTSVNRSEIALFLILGESIQSFTIGVRLAVSHFVDAFDWVPFLPC